MKQLEGMHHVTCITQDAEANHDFYTRILGMRLLKKTVNQDDVVAYHTFFGDEMASPGNDLTFFDFQGIQKSRRGTNSVTSVGLRVPSDEALTYWMERFDRFGVSHQGIDTQFNYKGVRFEDPDGLRLRLISDTNGGGFEAGVPNTYSDVPKDYAIVGLGTLELTVRHKDIQAKFLTQDLLFTHSETEGSIDRYITGPGGNSSSIHIIQDQTQANEVQGYGAVHHIALRVSDDVTLHTWLDVFRSKMYPNSGFVQRHYFQSFYTRIGTILYELATDSPGFTVDESIEHLGEHLSLPPFLEHKRASIEAQIRPFNTERIHYDS